MTAILPFEQALAVIGEVAAANRLASETLALPRCHGRVLAQDMIAATTDGHPGFRCGALMTPTRVALAASLGMPALPVTRRPTVAVFTMGDVLVEPGMPLSDGQRYDHNRELLMGLVRGDGLEPTAWPRLPDGPGQIEIALRDAGCAFDLIVVCGSSCSGNQAVADVVARFGQLHFDGVQMEPGSQALFGSLDQARLLAMPDEPIAVLATWLTLGRAAVDGLQGRLDPRPVLRARMGSPIDKAHSQRAFLPARIEPGSHGLRVDPNSPSLVQSNALIVVPEDARHVPAEAIVDVLPL